MIDHATLQPGMTFQHTGIRRKKLTTFVITKVDPSGVICHDEAEQGFGEFGQKVLRGNNQNCYNDREYAEE